MHLRKTKRMSKFATTVDSKNIEEADSHVYLGRKILLEEHIFPDLKQHIALGEAAFGKGDNIMRSRKPSMRIRRNTSCA